MRYTKLLFWLTPPILGLALYGPSLTLPFFWDDVPNFQYLYERSFAEIWWGTAVMQDYRPLGFTIWRLLQLIFGPTQSAAFHLTSVVCWIITAWLVGGLARLLAKTDNDLISWLAGVLFIAFPFAPQTITWITALFHPLVTLLTVASCICLLKFNERPHWVWAVLTVGFAGLAPFATQSGVVSAGLMTLCLLQRVWPIHSMTHFIRAKREVLGLIFIVLTLNILYIPLWAQAPKIRSAESLASVGLESLWQSSLFFLEGLTYPLQFLARPLMTLGVADIWAVLSLGSIALIVGGLLLRNKSWWFWALSYCYLAGLPVIVALPFSYTITSPRLMTITAPAAAILWAVVAVEAAQRLAWEKARPWVAVGAVVAMTLIPVWHIQRQMALYHLALDQVWGLIKEVQLQPSDKTLIVNAVDWVAPVQATYALGHEGVEVMPGYTNPQLLVWAHTLKLYQVKAVTFPLVFPQLNQIYFNTWGADLDWNAMAEQVRQADRVTLVSYSDERIEFRSVGRVTNANDPAQISFANRIELTKRAYALQANTIELQLKWRAKAASTEDIFANALDCDGNILGLSGGASLGGIYPIWLWQPGETIEETRRIPLEKFSPTGCYRVELGLFNPNTGERTTAYGLDGQRLENDVVVLQWDEPGSNR